MTYALQALIALIIVAVWLAALIAASGKGE